ncbi:SWIM zinc finger family protein [Streptomyces sp. NPDC004752]
MTADRERPADIARRALRAARKRTDADADAPQSPAPGSAGEQPRGTGSGAGEAVSRGAASGAARTLSPGAASGVAEAVLRGAASEVAEGRLRAVASRAKEQRPNGAALETAEESPWGAAPDTGGASHGADGADGTGGRPVGRPRPGDAARAAIRSAASAHRTGSGVRRTDEGDGASGAAVRRDDRDTTRSTTDSTPKAPVPSPTDEAALDTARPADAAATAGRPADAARQALRAARREPPGADGPSRPSRPSEPSGPPPDTSPAPVPPGTTAPEHTGTHTDQGTRTGSPLLPRTMATPHRDGELRRTFPALPSHTASLGPAASFAATWWGNAWIAALEQGALDAKRLARGRGYAEQGHVDAITVTPGLVLAYVRGSRPRPYRVQVRLRMFDEADWERFLDTAAEQPGRIAALLDRQLPTSLADGGAALLPGPGDLAPQCSCPDSGHPCKHAAALCYQTARLLDADPFVLLLLRGRGEHRLLDALSRRSATAAARAARDRQPRQLPGVRAAEALAGRELPPLPAPLLPPAHPGQPPVYPAVPGGPDPFDLDQLATDAAARAHALLSTGRDAVGELTLWQDAVRLAAARPGSGLTAATRALYSALAAAAGRTQAELARAVAAWRQGGPDGLAALEEPWDPPAGRFDRARPLLLAADLPAFRPWRNHLTHPQGHAQLRLGRDGLWYAYESEPGHDDWWPRGTPDPDPVGALTGLGIQSAD